jgi:hypothetical protein
LQAAQRYLQDAQASRACLGLLRQLANSDAIKASIVAASGLELVNQAVSCHLTSAGELAGDSYIMLQCTSQTQSSHQPFSMLYMTWIRQKVTEGLARQWP